MLASSFSGFDPVQTCLAAKSSHPIARFVGRIPSRWPDAPTYSARRPCLLANGHRPLEKLFGIGVAPLILVERGQVFHHIREIRMVRTERLLQGGDRPLANQIVIGAT